MSDKDLPSNQNSAISLRVETSPGIFKEYQLTGSKGGFLNTFIAGSGSINSAHNKFLPSVAVNHPGADVSGSNTNARTFSEAEDVRSIDVYPTANLAAEDDFVLVVIDAPNGSVEKTFLDATSLSDAINESFVFFKVKLNKKTSLPVASSAVRRIGFKTTIVCAIEVEAI